MDSDPNTTQTNQATQDFITKARERGLTDKDIKHKLLAGGWTEAQAADALTASIADDLVPPPPPSAQTVPTPGSHAMAAAGVTHSYHAAQSSDAKNQPTHPISVVENLTLRGFEYKIFSVTLVLALVALIFVADFSIGSSDWSSMAFPLTVLIVTGPLALFLFMRLHRAELLQPELRKDPSRRKVVQGIQLVTFLGVVVHTIIIVYLLLSGHYSSTSTGFGLDEGSGTSHGGDLLSDILRWLITVVLAGGTFLYYWRDDHRKLP
jgi:hypothetical protein